MKICFQVSHPYRTLTEGLPSFTPSPCVVVSFPSKEEENFKILRHLHEKEVQTLVTSTDKGIQTEVRVPCNRWTQMQLQEVEEDKGNLEDISKEVLLNLQMAVEETAAVDPLHDEWGSLSKLDKTETILQPLRVLQKQIPSPPRQPTEDMDQDQEDSFDEVQELHIDISKLQRMRKKIMKKVEEHRLAEASSETPVQKFARLYEEQRKRAVKLDPE